MKIGTGIDGDGDAALGQQCQFVRRRPHAMGQRQPRRQQADLVEHAHHAAGIVGIGPLPLIFGFQQMHVDAAAGAVRRFRNGLQQFVAAPLHAVGAILNIESRSVAPRRRRHRPAPCSRAATAACASSAARFRRGRPGAARRAGLRSRHRPADCGPSSKPQSRRERRHRAPRAPLRRLRSEDRSIPARACNGPSPCRRRRARCWQKSSPRRDRDPPRETARDSAAMIQAAWRRRRSNWCGRPGRDRAR